VDTDVVSWDECLTVVLLLTLTHVLIIKFIME
jgi:hypothetical protein